MNSTGKDLPDEWSQVTDRLRELDARAAQNLRDIAELRAQADQLRAQVDEFLLAALRKLPG